MIRFNNDYSCGGHERIIKCLTDINDESFGGYGTDEWCEKAGEVIKDLIDNKSAGVHFLTGGTQTNFTVIAAALRPFQGVISAETGHINVHETGAVENCGHKIITAKSSDGRITAEQINEIAGQYARSDIKEHIVCPKMVYISFPTEYGTIYSRKELKDISDVCRKYGMFLFIDGARLGYGLAAPECDVTLKDIGEYADVFYIGGTKCGAFFGEAVVITNSGIDESFRSYMKQNGAMLAKGWLLGLQFYELLKDGLYFRIAEQAVRYAMKIKTAFNAYGIPSYMESCTNQQFFIMPTSLLESLKEKYTYEFEKTIDESHTCVRFCTSWYTKEEQVRELINDVHSLLQPRTSDS